LTYEPDDTPFRLYRESGTALRTNTWINLAGTMDEIRQVAKELEEDDGTKHAMALKQKIEAAIPRFEEGERVKLLPTAGAHKLLMWLHRNARSGSIVLLARLPLPNQVVSHYMKDVLVVNALSIPFRTMRMRKTRR